MIVKVIFFILWAICLVGIVVGFGFMNDAFTIAGYKAWKMVGIGCSIGFVAGIVWYFTNVNTKK